MATRVVMPQAGQDLEVGVVTEWLKQVGDPVEKGEPLVAVETEKISLELEAPVSGTLLRILVPDGTETAILSTIGIIGEPGEDVSGLE
jgi:pyruvate/2-oxoglutarate dehydrogenase complex dihydrolipoamide acyltransferase (E2) component